jgi:hypothetical protein
MNSLQRVQILLKIKEMAVDIIRDRFVVQNVWEVRLGSAVRIEV